MNYSSVSTTSKMISKKFAYFALKRIFDILFSLGIILALFPIYLIIALLIKINSQGPVLYITQRLGKNKNHITIWKFRTMYIDADKRLQKLFQKHPEMKKEWEVFQKIKNDPRCTFIGKILRRLSLDELPQFFNVLQGSLSVVGPRPHFIFEIEETRNSPLNKYAEKILSTKPGITGIWQTSGRSLLSYEERIKLDCLYVDKQTFLFDLFLIIKTIPSLLFSKGAF